MRQIQNSQILSSLSSISLAFLIIVSSDQAVAENAPLRCAGAGVLQSISMMNWEAGLGSWVAGTHDIASPGDFDTLDWAAVSGLPDSRAGKAAFVANNTTGDCVTDEKTGALTLDSPPINIPAGALVPRISVEHWFDIELRWDGGNFKISVNGGAYSLIPASAIEVGSYNDTIFPALTNEGAEWNLNPLAGQNGFTGPDHLAEPPELPAWGESHINLFGIAEAGDTIKLRFDFGIDECGGNVGWYVDEVEFYYCSAEAPPSDTKLTLVKQVITDNGGGAFASDWRLHATGPNSFSGNGPSVTSPNNLAPGTYNLSESGGPTGYTASDWVCVGGTQNDADTITLALDEIATCTINNDDIAPTLKVVKTIVNDSGGTVSNPNDFGLLVDSSLVLNNATNTYDAGNHTASEIGLSGYQAGNWGGDCSSNGFINLMPGQTATCTITNDDISPILKVVKTVINDNGGTVTDENAFGLKVDGGNIQHNVLNAFNAGNHTVSEVGLPGYEPGTWGGDCNPNGSINLGLGEVATCTISNDDISPTLKVVKTIINDHGGIITDPNAFGLKVDGIAVQHNAVNEFDAGNHTVSESGQADYFPGKWGGDCNQDGTITLALDQQAVCTITNDDIDPNETIFKDSFE